MKPIPPEYQTIVARVAEKLARATPGMAEHLDDSAEIDAHLFAFTPPSGHPGPDRQDALDDVTAINQLFAPKD